MFLKMIKGSKLDQNKDMRIGINSMLLHVHIYGM